MMRKSLVVLGVVAVASLGSLACEDNRTDRAREDYRTGRTIPAATVDTAQAQKDLNKDQRDLADDKAKFDKERADYRAKVQDEIADLDKKIDDLKASAANTTGAAKDEADKALRDVTTKRADLTADLKTIEAATVASWDATKDRLDRAVDDLKSTVKTASTHIKAIPARAKNEPATHPLGTTR